MAGYPARARSRSEEATILLAVPKKGRLNEEVMKLLKGAGLDAKRPERLDVAMCTELPVKLVFLPAHDIPMYVMDGNVDIGISGSDMLEETSCNVDGHVEGDAEVKILMNLGFGKCKLCLQAPAENCAAGPNPFLGKRVVTSFPGLTKKYFDKLSSEEHKTKVKVVSGSVEAACGLGLADAIVDLVETGTTMRAAGLDIVSEVFSSEAIIMQQKPTEENGLGGQKGELVKLIMKRIEGYITATRNVFLVFNCEEKNLAACCAITPGKRSPTITKLQADGWVSVSVLVEKKGVHTLMDKLTLAGAQDLLCTALDNTRM
jgi:ATP phosphoribosyltransferase